jgi:hypothetical protein
MVSFRNCNLIINLLLRNHKLEGKHTQNKLCYIETLIHRENKKRRIMVVIKY